MLLSAFRVMLCKCESTFSDHEQGSADNTWPLPVKRTTDDFSDDPHYQGDAAIVPYHSLLPHKQQ